MFNELFSGAQGKQGEHLASWFDDATATLGGRDVIETVRELFGNVSRFDFQEVGRDLPQVDLADLERFFTLAVGRHRRRIFKRDGGIQIKAPDAWQSHSYAVRDHYDGLVFDRNLSGVNSAARVLGVGHTLFDIALEEARNLPMRVAVLGEAMTTPVLIVSVEDEVTDTGSLVHRLIFGVREVEGVPSTMRDWELLRLLNGASSKSLAMTPGIEPPAGDLVAVVRRLHDAFASCLSEHAPTLRRPVSWPEMLLVPSKLEPNF